MITVEQGQSLRDVAIQYCGDVAAALDIAVINGISITQQLVAGSTLAIPSVVKKDIVNYLAVNNLIPATDKEHTSSTLSGIGYWQIERDFIVS